jgi:hypothetical protein
MLASSLLKNHPICKSLRFGCEGCHLEQRTRQIYSATLTKARTHRRRTFDRISSHATIPNDTQLRTKGLELCEELPEGIHDG